MRNNSRCWKEIFWIMKVLLRCWPALFDIIFCGNMVRQYYEIKTYYYYYYSFINLISPYALWFKPPKVCFGRLVILLCKRWQSWVNGYDYVDQIREM